MAILNKFEQSNSAISVVDLVESLRQEMNKTTVYRILERLKNEGELHSFTGKDGRRWYAKNNGCDSNQQTHPHFQCKECGKVECLAFEVTIPHIPNYKIDSAKFLLIGQCEECLS
ncbi:MAG: transcriptional repressor [Bacteroidota bacterium]